MAAKKSIIAIALTACVICVLAVASACSNNAAKQEQVTKDTKQIITVGVDSETDNYAEVKMMNRNEDGT